MRVAVGAITRRRPEGLKRLLESFERMERPEGVDLVFVLVENEGEHSESTSTTVAQFIERVAEPVLLRLEPRRGIPFARNRVLETAEELSADYLTFIDDDEVVARDWLVMMLDSARSRGLDLAGGPVTPLAPQGRLTALQLTILDDLRQRAEREAVGRSDMATRDCDQHVDVYTNNWCLRVEAARSRQLWFDPATADSGGEDTKFSQDMLATGARNGWVPGAVVEEVQPPQRLTLRYQYKRMRDQTRMRAQREGFGRRESLKKASQRFAEAVALSLALPVVSVIRRARGRELLVRIVRKVALATGLVGGTLGVRSRHYAPQSEALHVEGSRARR